MNFEEKKIIEETKIEGKDNKTFLIFLTVHRKRKGILGCPLSVSCKKKKKTQKQKK
jgi:hypothetical protein